MPHGLEVLSTRKHALAPLGDRRLSLGGNKRLAALALIHSVHNHTDDDGNDSTTHTTRRPADQREIEGLEVHSSLLNMVLHQTPGITKGSDGE